MRLPPRVHEEDRRYVGCGDVRRGFTVVRCDDCARSELVAFWCKSRAWCPCCGARRVPRSTVARLRVEAVTWPEDDYQALLAKSTQLRLPLDDAAPARRVLRTVRISRRRRPRRPRAASTCLLRDSMNSFGTDDQTLWIRADPPSSGDQAD